MAHRPPGHGRGGHVDSERGVNVQRVFFKRQTRRFVLLGNPVHRPLALVASWRGFRRVCTTLTVDGVSGALTVEPPLSKRGDRIVFEAHMDLVIGRTSALRWSRITDRSSQSSGRLIVSAVPCAGCLKLMLSQRRAKPPIHKTTMTR